ncbi:MAG: serine/threonine protein kinase [Verrucomicrobia bacterium]|jgi:hypothetical protein|nr:serine/threonine protein kinase [Verrucomicrobiota bacterium]
MAGNVQVMAIVSAALAKPAGTARDAFVQQACAGDARLLAQVQEELRLAQSDDPGTVAMEAIPAAEGVGACLGAYKLLQEIGEGGCGMVYLAEQAEPIRRRVALKIIKLGMDSRQVIARFEAERQALAMMDHPNIAKVLDAGTTNSGRPYFVMELVRGIPITRYCDEAKLATRERLLLFIEVCKAIQHAHQKGIIHRDIKPSNVLVALHDNEPIPKVIDFGIAKATEAKLTDKTLFTGFAQFIGTPAYMSPEQAGLSALDIDTRSDIYSLGVLLYELLIGRPPFKSEDLAQAGLDEARRRIREEDPVKPSTRLHSTQREEMARMAARRSMSPGELVRSVEGDLDWIVMKALEKERTRRYDSASSLAKDIERFLNNETILARPPSGWYRLEKFARRNKVAFVAGVVMVIAAGAVFATLSLGLAVSTIMFFREREARRAATMAQQEAALTQAEVIAFGNPELIERVTQAREFQGKVRDAAELVNAGRLMEAEPILNELAGTSARGGNVEIQALRMRADLRARQSRFREAATDLNRLIEMEPDDHWHWFILAPLLVHLGEDTAYDAMRRAMLVRFKDTENALTAERVAKAAMLRALDEEDTPGLDQLVRTIVRQGAAGQQFDEFSQYRDAFNLCESLAEYRQGDYTKAIQAAGSVAGSSYIFFQPVAQAVQAMSYQHLGRPAEARAALAASRRIVQEQLIARTSVSCGMM